jgi:hypothetical protein
MTLILSPTGRFSAYWYPDLSLFLRKLFGYISTFPVQIADCFLTLDDHVFDHHDLLHYEISLLDRIRIGKDMVSGIHGVCLPFFPDGPTVSEYDGLLDEARVAMHEWLTRPTIYNTCKLFNWFVWLSSQRINPLAVLLRHYFSIRRYRGNSHKAAIQLIQQAEAQGFVIQKH